MHDEQVGNGGAGGGAGDGGEGAGEQRDGDGGDEREAALRQRGELERRVTDLDARIAQLSQQAPADEAGKATLLVAWQEALAEARDIRAAALVLRHHLVADEIAPGWRAFPDKVFEPHKQLTRTEVVEVKAAALEALAKEMADELSGAAATERQIRAEKNAKLDREQAEQDAADEARAVELAQKRTPTELAGDILTALAQVTFSIREEEPDVIEDNAQDITAQLRELSILGRAGARAVAPLVETFDLRSVALGDPPRILSPDEVPTRSAHVAVCQLIVPWFLHHIGLSGRCPAPARAALMDYPQRPPDPDDARQAWRYTGAAKRWRAVCEWVRTLSEPNIQGVWHRLEQERLRLKPEHLGSGGAVGAASTAAAAAFSTHVTTSASEQHGHDETAQQHGPTPPASTCASPVAALESSEQPTPIDAQHWLSLSDRQQKYVTALLTCPYGETQKQSWIIETGLGKRGGGDKRDRDELNAMIPLGLVLKVGERGGYRLLREPSGTPPHLKRGSGWPARPA